MSREHADVEQENVFSTVIKKMMELKYSIKKVILLKTLFCPVSSVAQLYEWSHQSDFACLVFKP